MSIQPDESTVASRDPDYLGPLLARRTAALGRVTRELDEARAALARVEALHVKVFTSVSDEVYGNNPTCLCGHHWPCETLRAINPEETD